MARRLKGVNLIVFIGLAVISIIVALFEKTPPKTTQEVKHNEKFYQEQFCHELKGEMEYRLKDKTRVDCLTAEYAIEVDWAKKWAEGIGQALYYGVMTEKKPAVALIVGEGDEKYLKRLNSVARSHGIKVYRIQKAIEE